MKCELVIVGAGPAGLAAAQAAASRGCDIVIIDDNPRAGGQIWRNGPQHAPGTAARARLCVLQLPSVRYLPGTRIIASPAPGCLLLENAEQGLLLHYQQLILCCGARELLLPFPGWTLPGVTGAGALQALVKNGMPMKDERTVIAGSGPLLLASAATAQQAGAKLLRVLEQAPMARLLGFSAQLWRWPSKAVQAISLATASYRTGALVLEALGDQRLQAVRIQQGQRVEEIECDHLACGYGLIPNTQLASHLGCQLNGNAVAVDLLQRTSRPAHLAAGECTGVGASELALIEGEIAGWMAVGEERKARELLTRKAQWQRFADQLRECFTLTPKVGNLARADTLLCRCEDIALRDIQGQPGWTAAKLQSRCGMGACQGRVCGTAAQVLFGWTPTPPRAPLVPARIGTLLLEGTAQER
ncbi:NAD(P)/FAD-dependent oxidoreductase [Pseudomonas tussilaginis]|uniref:NAD(P)/FAD-dependent oxidoreductase n=1 Tax=Pseudomonas sp. 5 TaxID=1619949 RepID=UPI0005EB7CC9|nr:FAD/NAD(P)-binding oxidoreductase [Pseudomonas sp. 5]KJK08332.1 pyridine nucleotide-disulfide oxidoreductase [Pseudomonas sp. 5]